VKRPPAAAWLCLATALAMGGALWNGFVYDDVPIIANNPLVTDLRRFLEIPAATYWTGTLWRPVAIAGYALQWAAGGGAAWVFHLVSLLSYTGIGWLLVRLATRLGISRNAALVAGLTFLVHPVHVEVVANTVGQAELWVGACLLGAALLFGARERQARDSMRTLALVAIAMLGTAAKESGFVIAALLLGLLCLFPPGHPLARRREAGRLVVVTLVTALMFVIRSRVTGTFAGEFTAPALAGAGIATRGLTFLAVVPEYTRLLLWPSHLQAEYGPPALPIGGPIGARHLLGVAIVMLVLWALVRLRRTAPVAAFGLFWGVVTLAPVSNVLVPTGLVMAERVLFLPSIGVALAASAGIEGLWRQRHRAPARAVVMLGLAWMAALAVRSITRVPVWRTEQRFFTQLPEDAPQSYRAWLSSGQYWGEVGKDSLAEFNLRRARRLWPSDPKTDETLGQLLRARGDCASAIPVLQDGLALAPDRTSIRARLIECLVTEGNLREARRIAATGDSLGASGFVQRVDQADRAGRGSVPP
jgi:hypothetical protein